MKPSFLAPERGVHKVNPTLMERMWRIHLIGAGGNGSHMAFGLARLNAAMRELGHPGGLDVIIWDDDTVSEANVGRQLFAMSDVGLYKSVVLANRINLFYGTAFSACPRRFESLNEKPELVISCVDSAKSRRQIHSLITGSWKSPLYWLDLGNGERDGQFVLGQPLDGSSKVAETEAQRLRCVTELFPELLDEDFQEDDTPSCSLAEALSRQSLFVNQVLSAHALALLWNLFRYGEVNHCGGFVNLATGTCRELPVKPVK